MNTDVLCAIIGAVGGFLGVLAGLPLMNYRIQQLEKKVDKHNCLVERTYRLEAEVEVLKNERSVSHERTVVQTN